MQVSSLLSAVSAARSGRRNGQFAAWTLLPGIALATSLAVFSLLSGDLAGGLNSGLGPMPVSPIIVAILAGAAIRNIVGVDAVFQPGLCFALKQILQLGVVLLGIRLSLTEIYSIGAGALPIVIVCITSALLIIAAEKKVAHGR